jgi:MFS-type transporter involved in bile tolerance (Atg22 family)
MIKKLSTLIGTLTCAGLAAAVAEMVPSTRVASAYGLFNLLYGVAWFAGSATMGVLYDVSIPLLVGFCVSVELLAIPLLLRVHSLRSSGAKMA